MLHPHCSKRGQRKREKQKKVFVDLTDSLYDYVLCTVIQVKSANVDPG